MSRRLGHPPSKLSSCELREQSSDLLDLVIVDAVTHAWINLFCHRGAERPQHASCLMHPVERNMWIGVAASEKDRSASELTCVVAWRAFRADKAAA